MVVVEGDGEARVVATEEGGVNQVEDRGVIPLEVLTTIAHQSITAKRKMLINARTTT